MSSLYSLSTQVVTTFEKPVLSGLDFDEGAHQSLGSQISYDSGHYVFEVTKTCNDSHFITSLSDRSIAVYDAQYMTPVRRILAHGDRINAIEASTTSPHLLYSAGSDKKACVWDLRVPSSSSSSSSSSSLSSSSSATSPSSKLDVPALQVRGTGEVLSLSVGTGDCLLATAIDTSVCFYDIRAAGNSGASGVGNMANHGSMNAKLLGEYADVHTDMITQIQFNRTQPSVLATAAEDGLICLYNTSVNEEEEAVMSILNTECPVRRFGFFGPENEGLYCLSTTEISSFWHFPSAIRVANFPNIREELSVDYLVDCFYDRVQDRLSILTGDYNGLGKIAHVEPGSLKIACEISGGHAASIRTVCTATRSQGTRGQVNVMVTGGEDSRLCVWEESTSTAMAMEGGGIEMEEGEDNGQRHGGNKSTFASKNRIAASMADEASRLVFNDEVLDGDRVHGRSGRTESVRASASSKSLRRQQQPYQKGH